MIRRPQRMHDGIAFVQKLVRARNIVCLMRQLGGNDQGICCAPAIVELYGGIVRGGARKRYSRGAFGGA